MFICIYQPIYTILFGMVHCNLCAPTAILGDLSVVGDLIVLLRQTRGDPTALPQEVFPQRLFWACSKCAPAFYAITVDAAALLAFPRHADQEFWIFLWHRPGVTATLGHQWNEYFVHFLPTIVNLTKNQICNITWNWSETIYCYFIHLQVVTGLKYLINTQRRLFPV